MGMPVNLRELNSQDLADPQLANLNSILRDFQQTLNYVLGFSGPVQFANDLDLQDHNIKNLGTPTDSGDALCQTSADPLYGAAVQQKNMSAVGRNILSTTRQLNNPNQREQNSSFLNDTLSTPPGSNAATVNFTTIDASHTQINVTADKGSLADSTVIPFSARSDIVTNPTSYTIAATPTGAVRAAGIVTIKTTTPHAFTPGQFANVNVTGDPSFNGNFIVLSVPDSTHFTYAQAGPDTTNGGGTASLGGVYYYYLRKSDSTLQMVGPFSTDTAANRINANRDGQQFVAVATVTGTGGSTAASGGGGDSIDRGGCTEIGTPLKPPTGFEEFTVDIVPCSDWVDVETADGLRVSFARDTLITVFIRVQDLESGALLEGEDGSLHPLKDKRFSKRESWKQVVRVKPHRTYFANGLRPHNVKVG